MFLKIFYKVLACLRWHASLCPSWSKGFDSSSNVFVRVGSNPTGDTDLFDENNRACMQNQILRI